MKPAIAIAGRQQHAVGTELKRSHPIGMFADFVQQFAGFGGVDPHDPSGTAQSDTRQIVVDIAGQHNIEFIANGQDAFARLDVVQRRNALRHGDQQGHDRVTDELQPRCRRVGQHAEPRERENVLVNGEGAGRQGGARYAVESIAAGYEVAFDFAGCSVCAITHARSLRFNVEQPDAGTVLRTGRVSWPIG